MVPGSVYSPDSVTLPAPAGPTDSRNLISSTDEESAAEGLPSFPAAAQAAGSRLEPGQRLGDFELLAELGRGGFARVFLARQWSLNRTVALKVSVNQSTEAHALARLEHDGIVRIYDEGIDWQRNLRLLWMQYVPGASLQQVLARLAERERREWTGRTILEAVAAASPQAATLDLAALRDLQRLEDSDFAEAVCWLGARLAEALAYAHDRGVLHRDVKPANILINPYGRPLLADFNLAGPLQDAEGFADGKIGGTLAYMAPEHLDAFRRAAAPDVVDTRSDIYSLGLVLFEMLTGRLPFEDGWQDLPVSQAVQVLATQRRSLRSSPRQVCPEVPAAIDRVVIRCLEPEPGKRYATAAELARALEGCGELCRAEKQMPQPGLMTRTALRHPVLVGTVLPLLPHLVGFAVVLGYNMLWLAGYPDGPRLLPPFVTLALAYSAVAFPLTGWLTYTLGRPILAAVIHLQRGGTMDSATAATLRRRALCKPTWALLLSGLGWLPGGLVMPLLLSRVAGPLGWETYLHLALSFTIAGLISLTYNTLECQFLILRVIYPQLWVDPQDLRRTARNELRGVERQLYLMQLWPVLIPLTAGAASMAGMVTTGSQITSSNLTFQFMILVLIILGMMGCLLAMQVSRRLLLTLNALTGG